METLDEELRRLERELAEGKNINRQNFIKRMIERLKKLKDLIATDEAAARELETLISITEEDWLVQLRRSQLDGILRRLTRNRAYLNGLLERFGKLARLLGHIVGEGTAHAAQLAGKAFRLIGHLAIPIDIILIIADNPSNIAVPYKQYDLIDTLLVDSKEGDNIRCYFACVYHHSYDRIDDDPRQYPIGYDDEEELVIYHEYDCGNPPSLDVLDNACKKQFFIQAE